WTTLLCTPSLHDALPIWQVAGIAICIAHDAGIGKVPSDIYPKRQARVGDAAGPAKVLSRYGHHLVLLRIRFINDHQLLITKTLRSEEHTSELQSRENLVC